MGSPTLLLAVLSLFAISLTPAQATDFTIFGNVNYNGGVSGAAIVRALDANGSVADQVSVADGNGSYSLSVPEGQAYDIKAFIDGNDNGNLDADWTVGEPYAHHGDWNDTTESFNLLQVDGNRTGIDLDITWHGDNDNDGFDDWEEYSVGSNGDDNSSFPVTLSGSITFDGEATGSVRMELRPNAGTATVTVKMLDDYGDGWNGALLTIKDDSNQTAFSGTLHVGDENETGVELEAGNNYFVSVTSGEYPEEVSWNIHTAGAVIASGGSPVTRQAFSPSVELMKKTLPQPGAYQWKLPNNGSYELSAFLDLDEDGESDLSEPFGFHAGGLVTLSSASLSGINIELPWNNAPTDIHLSGATVAENHSAGIVVGELNATDSNDDDTHYYEFVDGNGSAHNHLFVIDANGILRTAAVLDYESNASLNIRVRVTDQYDAPFEKVFAIHVTNVVEDPDGDGIENHADLDDDGDGFTDAREIEGGSNPDDNESFLISLSGSVSYEGNASGSVLMQVRSATGPTIVTVEMLDNYGDGWNGALLTIKDDSNQTVFSGTLHDGDENETGVELEAGNDYFVSVTSGEYSEEVSWAIHSAGAVVASGGAPVTGQDFSPFGNLIEVTLAQLGSYQLELPNNTTYRLGAFLDVDGDGDKFPLEPAGLHSKEPISVSGNLSEINIEMVDNTAPNDLVLSAGSLTENQPLGTLVGTFTATDPDDSNGSGTYSFYLVGGEGSKANWAFAIEGNRLRSVFSLDYEDHFEPGPIEGLSYHPIRVGVSDNRGASIEKTFFITVSDDPLDNPLQVPMLKVDPPDGTKGDLFGSSVSLLGDLLMVGATEGDLSDRNDTGATYLFRIEANGSSTYLSKLTAHDGNEGDNFGTSVSQAGDFLAIGATRADMDDRNDTGAAYVFHMATNDGTTFVAKVAAPDGSVGDGFGHSVSISNEFLSVGAPFSDEGEDGAVYLYRMEANGSVSHLTKLMAPDGTQGGNFGHSISESDDLLLIGANKADVNDQGEAGKAYLYRIETNGSATYLTRLTAPDGEEGDRFSQSVSREGEFLAIGAPFADHNGISDAGIVYLYEEETNGSVTLLAKVTAVDSAKGDRFGMAISQSDDLLAVMSGNGIYLYRVDANGSSIATTLGKVSLNWAGQPEALYLAGDKLVVGHKKSDQVHVVDLALLNNTAPSNLYLGNSTLSENQAHGTVVGKLHAIDPDDQNGSGHHFFEFADGNGSDHNLLFHIDENDTLRTNEIFDYETSPTLSIRVRTTDEFDASVEKVFSINVTNVVEDLDGDGIENHADPDDDGDGFTDTEEVEGGSNPDDNASFLITVSGTVTYEGNATGKIRVLVMEELEGGIEIEMIDSYGDGWNGAELTILDDANVTVYVGTFETGHEARDTIDLMAGKTYFVNVSDGEYPEEVSWNIFSENQVLATGDTSSAGASFLAPGLVTEIVLAQAGAYQLTSPSNFPFLIGAFLDLDDDGGIAPLEPAALHSEETIVATGNLAGINIEMVDNGAPTNLSLSVQPVTENRQAGSFVGIFSATDPDDLNATDFYFYDLVDGNGSDHNHHFAIEDNRLKAVFPDYESGPIHSIRVRASDDRGAFFEKTFFITVIDDPVDNPLDLEHSRLLALASPDEDEFGAAVSFFGDLLAIGATRASGVDENETGAAYLYEVEANSSATYLTKLLAPDGSAGDGFGKSISLSDDLLAIGAIGASGVNDNRTGAVYLYGVETNGSTHYLTKLTAPDGTEWDYFGSSISLSDDLLAVGAARAGGEVDANRTGAVYLYGIEANGSTTFLTKLTAPTGTKSEGFGFSISQSGSLLAVAAGWADLGGVYLYRTESNGTATYMTKLTAPDGVAEDWFGSSVGVLDNIVVVGASGVDHNGMGDAGAVYLYRMESNGTATYLTKLMAPDARSYSYFGHLVSQTGDLLAIGSKVGTYLYRVDANGSSITTLGKATLEGEAINENLRTAAISTSGELLAVGMKLESPEEETDEEDEGDSGEETSVVHVLSLSNLSNNRSPSDLRLSNATVDENKNPGTLVGQLQVVDLDDQSGTDQYHFELVDGNGSQHNHLFSQANGELKTNAFLDYEANATLSLRVRVTDKYNGTLEVPLEVEVIDTFAPIVRTLTVKADGNGSTTFRGEILTDGNSDVTVVGMEVSDGLPFVNPIILFGHLDGLTDEFSATITTLEPNKTYYYRIFATNAEGTGRGIGKRFVTPGAASTALPWWSTLSESEGDWYILPWFGTFLPFDNGWIYHTDLGWLYAQPDGAEGLWFWSEGQGWLWTNPDSYRYLYRASTSGWIYFLKSKDGRAYFYNYATGSVE